ncbi:hypothetical protein MGYG_08121 [Nannizzia gypsea CBS 118893]|uniref:Uncharacterized protein n=1 Tax=Arthroderma gypseum (strain ATCC MYA-4604 / CBS 118893) TaxID=535722 RepID=E4V538_ARTGP|nr:hypothetical protein MGYG_08121 [Nannizzia gypsea CBS 118893]EFR05112.1 hypothetical protein MGYG_08121 [Nannizzia gypsea CBS 118893]
MGRRTNQRARINRVLALPPLIDAPSGPGRRNKLATSSNRPLGLGALFSSCLVLCCLSASDDPSLSLAHRPPACSPACVLLVRLPRRRQILADSLGSERRKTRRVPADDGYYFWNSPRKAKGEARERGKGQWCRVMARSRIPQTQRRPPGKANCSMCPGNAAQRLFAYLVPCLTNCCHHHYCCCYHHNYYCYYGDGCD